MRIALGDHCPDVHESGWIAPNATVIGQVRLGEQVGIWYNAVVRGDIVLEGFAHSTTRSRHGGVQRVWRGAA